MRRPTWGLRTHSQVIKGLGGLDRDIRLFLQDVAALATGTALGAATYGTAEPAVDTAAAAAAPLTAGGEAGHHLVPRLQRAHPLGQAAKIPQPAWQGPWAAGL